MSLVVLVAALVFGAITTVFAVAWLIARAPRRWLMVFEYFGLVEPTRRLPQ